MKKGRGATAVSELHGRYSDRFYGIDRLQGGNAGETA
jgi:hypothetical protein